MRNTSRTLALASIILLACAPARAAFRQRPATRAELDTAEQIATTYWREHAPTGLALDGVPLCGTPRIVWRRFPADDPYAAETVTGGCRITFDLAAFPWPTDNRPHVSSGSDTWPAFCTALAHEWGHLILGPIYFAATNPTDPAHSPNPADLMFAVQTRFLPACLRTADPGSGLWEHVSRALEDADLHHRPDVLRVPPSSARPEHR